MKEKDFTPTGLRVEGSYENDRNADSHDLFKSIIHEAYDAKDCIIAHHLTYVAVEKRADGFDYQIVEEIPSADTLIFDHSVAKKIWGTGWRDCLVKLAMEPIATRDTLLRDMYEHRSLTP